MSMLAFAMVAATGNIYCRIWPSIIRSDVSEVIYISWIKEIRSNEIET